MKMSLILAAALCAFGTAGGAWADTAPDTPVTTKPTTPPPPSAPADATVQQIDSWVHASGDDMAPPEPADTRKVHGTISAGVGTGGYREISATAEGKIGSADVGIAVQKIDGGRGRRAF